MQLMFILSKVYNCKVIKKEITIHQTAPYEDGDTTAKD
jgi:hypothetical protein